MSHHPKKDKTTVRYLVTETRVCVQVEDVKKPEKFKLEESAKSLLNQGYEILESDLPKKAGQALEHRTYTVYLRERVTIVFPHQPKEAGQMVDGLEGLVWPEGLAADDLRQVRSREVLYRFEDGSEAAPSHREDVVFERSAMVNHVTNEVTYTEWQPVDSTSFEAVASPDLLGYSTERAQVPGLDDITIDSEPLVQETVTYLKDKQEARLRVLDADTREELFAETLLGATNDPIDYPTEELIEVYLSKGYELIDNPFEETCYFNDKADEDQVFTIEVRPRVVNLSLDALPVAGQAVYADIKGSVKWPKGIERSKLQRLVKRTIVTQHEDGEVIDKVEQVVEFERSASVDLFKQEVTYGDWKMLSETAVFPAYTPEVLDGYSPRPRRIPELGPVTPDSVSLTETIVYSKKIQRVNIQFVDRSKDGHLLYQEQLVGKTGEPLRASYRNKIQEFINNGYEVVDNSIPEDARFSADEQSIKDYVIGLTPKVVVVLPDAPKAAGSFIEAGSKTGPKWPVGVDEASLKRLITRTVYHCFENGKEAIEPYVAGILFERQAEINLVTGQVSYGDWQNTKDTFEAYDAPELPGYYTTKSGVPAMSGITVDSADFDTVIHYIKATNQLSYTIVDKDSGAILETQVVNGRSVQKLREDIDRRLVPYLNRGYQLEDSDRLTLALKQPDLSDLTIELTPRVERVTLAQPRAAFSLVKGYGQVSWPAGLERANLIKEVTRTITFTTDQGQELQDPIVQTARLTRTAQANLVSGQVTYSDWQGEKSSFAAVDVPEHKGYTASLTSLPEQVLTAGDLSRVVPVTYYPQVSHITLIYRELGADDALVTDVMAGQTGDQLDYDLAEKMAAHGLLAYDVVANQVPDKLSFSDDEQVYEVILQAKVLTISSDQAQAPYSVTYLDDYGLFTWPEGLDQASLTGQIRRRVTFRDEVGRQQLAPAQEQVINLTREAKVDLVTKAVTYTPWTSEVTHFDAIPVPQIDGYRADTTEVPLLDVASLDELVGLVLDNQVTYYAQPYQCRVTFINALDKTLLRQLDLTVADKDTVLKTIDDMVAWYQSQGYTKQEQALDVSDWEPGQHKDFALILEPQLLTVSLEQVHGKFHSFDDDVAAQLQVLEGLTSLNLSRQVVRTINYVYTNGKQVAPSYHDKVTFKRTARVNLVTNEVFYDQWTSYYPVFDEVLSPVSDGYTPSKEIVEAIEAVDADSPNIIETIVYARNIQQVVVNVIDKSTGNVIYTESITDTNGDYSSSHKLSQFVQKGYELVSNQETAPVEPVAVTAQPTGLQDSADLLEKGQPVKAETETIKVKHITAVKPLVLNKDDAESLRQHGLTTEDVSRELVREIHYNYSDGSQAADQIRQVVTYERLAELDTKGQVVLGDWTPDLAYFDELPSPSIEGYTPDVALAEEEAAPLDSDQHRILVVTYSKAKTENLSIIFTDQDTGEELLTFNFANKGREFSEKKIKKGVSFLKYKGYKVVASDYPDKGELIKEDTLAYHVFLSKSEETAEAPAVDKVAETINKKVEAEEFSQKQKGFFERLFKD